LTTKIPTCLLDQIDISLRQNGDIVNYNEKKLAKLKRLSITLWLFIYNQQMTSDNDSYEMYVNIAQKELRPFKTVVNGRTFQYSDIIRLLLTAKVIDVNQKYKIGKFPKSYRINLSFLEATNFTEVEINLKKLYRNLKTKKYWLKKYPFYQNLIENSYKVKIDLDGYIQWLIDNTGKDLKLKYKNGQKIKQKINSIYIYESIQKCLKIHFQNLWFKATDSGRFYSSVTNLPSTVIPFITLKGKKLVSVDIANCQPLLLASKICSKKYKKDVGNGMFYNQLSKTMNVDRNEIKLRCFRYIFFNQKPLKSGELYDAMEKLYPSVIHQINALKEKEMLWYELQKIESKIIVEKIGVLPNICVLTRHDELLCFEENRKLIIRLIKERFEEMKLEVTFK
tara:strand:- start:3334 stop:4515 length:1182 start_codon:yes stop_codon:yes gene_type:complete